MRAAATERRTALLEAAIALIGRHGMGAVTHRSVAAAAGVPSATTGYYFNTREQLVDEALATLAARELEELRARHARLGPAPTVERTAAALAAWLLERATLHGAAALAHHQLAIEAARRPDLALHLAALKDEADALAVTTLRDLGAADPPLAAITLVSALDGLLLRLLTQPASERDPEALARALRVLLVALTTVRDAIPNSI